MLLVCRTSERTEMAIIVQRYVRMEASCTIFVAFEVKKEIPDKIRSARQFARRAFVPQDELKPGRYRRAPNWW